MAKIVKLVTDSLTNLVSKLGTERDKNASSVYGAPEMSDAELMNAYRGAWLPRKIVDIPALDATRKWRDWEATPEQIEKIEEEERRLGLQGKVLEAMIKARLFGGAALFIGTGKNASSELDPESVGSEGLQYLTVFPKSLLSVGEIVNDPLSPLFGKPEFYEINQVKIHATRLAVFRGNIHPDEQYNPNKGWGDSILVAVMKALKNADNTADNIASLVFEAVVDVIKLPDFMANLSDPAYRARLIDRYALAAQSKGINGTLMLDIEEEYEKKTTAFATLPDVLDRFLQIVAGAADIPVTRLLGQAPSGLNATGEFDLRNYYDRVASMQQLDMRPALYNLDECLIRSALGSRPPEVHYAWSSLWQVTDKERVDMGKVMTSMIKELNDTGLYPPEAVANAGANMLVEGGVLPGFEQEIEDAGGLPDFEALAEEEAQREIDLIKAKSSGGKGPSPFEDYDPNQPRVPAGNPDGGQWTTFFGGQYEMWPKKAMTKEERKAADERMRQEVLAAGAADGNEHLVAYDAVTGQRLEMVTDGHPMHVAPSAAMTDLMGNPDRQLVFHHNHPDLGGSLSDGDLAQLGAPGVIGIWAHGTDGSSYYAESLVEKTNPAEWWHGAAPIVTGTAETAFILSRGRLPMDADLLSLGAPHIINQMLAETGVIKYQYKLGHDAKLADEIFTKSGIKAAAREAWSQSPFVSSGKLAEELGPEEYERRVASGEIRE